MINRVALVLVLGAVWLGLGGDFARGAPSVYDGFNYANDASPLSGQTGGYGWAGPWNETGSVAGNQFTLSQNETSLDLPNLPFEPVGDRVVALSPGGSGNDNRISRPIADPFSLAADGALYASFLFSKAGAASGSNNNQEMVFLSGTAQAIRLGSTSTNLFWVGATTQTAGPITLGETYFLVVRVDALASGSDTIRMLIFDSTETVPLAEPAAYDQMNTFTSNATLNGLQFHIGNIASGAFDELRLGSTWADVTSANPNFILGDFDGMNGITVVDYQILRDHLYTGTTYEHGDFNLNGLVDLTDFALFRQKYQSLGFSLSDLDGPNVPEPAAAVLFGVAGCLFAASARRRHVRSEFARANR